LSQLWGCEGVCALVRGESVSKEEPGASRHLDLPRPVGWAPAPPLNVRFGSISAIQPYPLNVRVTLDSGHRADVLERQLRANSRRRALGVK
jgi:hypothetical protein